jgi:hypothetical protein
MQIAERLVAKIKQYLRSHSPKDDLTPQETSMVYRKVDYGERLPLTNKRDVNVEWSDHAEYRGDLRDINPRSMNKDIAAWLRDRLTSKGADSKKVVMKTPSGRAVVNYDLRGKPAEAEVVTVYAGTQRRGSRIAGMIRAELLVAPDDSIVRGQEYEADPTATQKKSNSYRKGQVFLDGMDIRIENPLGSIRSGIAPDGRKWSCQMKADYGYIAGTSGFDKDQLDVFIKPGYKGGGDTVFVINQIDPESGEFDEHKCVLGVKDAADAKKVYLANYEKDWRGLGTIVPVPLSLFLEWIKADGVGPAGGKLGLDGAGCYRAGRRMRSMARTGMEERQ